MTIVTDDAGLYDDFRAANEVEWTFKRLFLRIERELLTIPPKPSDLDEELLADLMGDD